MEEINNTAFFRKVLIRGCKTMTYTKVKMSLAGAKSSLDDREKKHMVSVLDEVYKQAKENILKS